MGAAVSNRDLVFSHVDGTPLLPHSISQAWSRLAKRAGYPEVRLHDARHSHASLMLALGVHPKVVSERLGHNSVSLTLDVYSHVLPGIQEAAALAFDEGFNNTIIKEHGSEGIRGKIY
ncbi:MAG: site-specific integrase [SAR202 cluster bacterium]|nr:site-specific integrase [SAR202 cluster bacterium]